MKRKKQKSIILRIVILGVCAYFTVTLASLWGQLNESRNTLNNLKEQHSTKQNDINELKAMLESDSDKQLIEKAARERLGFIFSDEQVFIDVSGN